ncbi:hypothetical protein T265_09481 [Opisthorchis viverrini]|uniref:Uncharacterized protein n=1 Tax=Opisthorchis viverrini TaxID=6198 RepID=A0A074ZGR6_OPIVI|nr:hypothetical protein T265_09481 [Opisthorchis viverrini]KER22435.1 hypothetical protein T265_09481 [Opisthorchis viverrini]
MSLVFKCAVNTTCYLSTNVMVYQIDRPITSQRRRLSLKMALWLGREVTDRKVRGSNPTSSSRLSLSRLGQHGSIPGLVLSSGGMAVKHRKGAITE